jgi:nuclear GTP-binding protein
LVEFREETRDKRMEAGQSKRIWEELYKVLDSSDVVVQVIDARDPNGTRCRHVEEHLKNNCPNKHLILVLNKCDLVPTWVTTKWVKHLSKEYPTLAYHASVTNPFGKGSLIQILRQVRKKMKNSNLQQGITLSFSLTTSTKIKRISVLDLLDTLTSERVP